MSIDCLGYLPRRIQCNDSTWKSLDVQYKVNVLSYNIIILRPFSLQIQTCMEILESILLYTAEESQLANRLGVSIVQRVLQGHMKLLYSCLNPGNPPEVIKAALKLLTAMVTQGSSAAREVQSSFDFTLKSLGALPNKCDSNVSHCTVEINIQVVHVQSTTTFTWVSFTGLEHGASGFGLVTYFMHGVLND